jgi:hypothetical protein
VAQGQGLMPTLAQRLAAVLGDDVTVVEEDEDGLTVNHDGTVASLRVVALADDLEMVSLTQPLAWDLPLNAKTRERVGGHASRTMLGTVVLVEKLVDAHLNGSSAKGATKRTQAKRAADVLLRYNFPASGLTDDALRTLILLVLATGADVKRELAT